MCICMCMCACTCVYVLKHLLFGLYNWKLKLDHLYVSKLSSILMKDYTLFFTIKTYELNKSYQDCTKKLKLVYLGLLKKMNTWEF